MDDTPGDKQPMRVLYCILDNRFGGPHRLAETTARHLRPLGVETLFLLGRKTDEPWRPDDFESFFGRYIQAFTWHRPVRNFARFCLFLPRNLLKIRKIIRSRRIDIVHIDGSMTFVPALAAACTRTPIVWLYNDHPFGPLRWFLRLLLTVLASKVIVQGERLQPLYAGGSARLRNKTVVLRSTVDTAALAPDRYDAGRRQAVRAELGVPADCTLVGAVGNVNRFKGYEYLVEAAAQIKKEIGPVKFLIVGRKADADPRYWEALQQSAGRLGVAKDIIYTGFRDDVMRILSVLDVFVLPSTLESCPVAVLEAMAMRVPVVATDVGAVSEEVIDGVTGLLVPSRDAAAIADAVVTHLRRPRQETDQMLSAARHRVETVFSLSEVVRQQKSVYEELLSH